MKCLIKYCTLLCCFQAHVLQVSLAPLQSTLLAAPHKPRLHFAALHLLAALVVE